MNKRLLHYWRLLTQPSGRGRLFGGSQPRGWRVMYTEGGTSIPMAYDVACDYAKAYGGEVVKA